MTTTTKTKAQRRTTAPDARLLDITRLISRAGRPLTGIDRVELAYLEYLLRDPVPLFTITRTPLGYVLLDDAGSYQMLKRFQGLEPWGNLDLIGRFMGRRGGPKAVRQAQADCRRFAVERCRPRRLAKMLATHFPKWLVYLNVGHSNLTTAMARAVKSLPKAEFVALLHDTIPLDFPLYQRVGTVTTFRKKLGVISRHADLVISNSRQTDLSLRQHCEKEGRVPPSIIAHLGVEVAAPDTTVQDRLGIPSKPYFVTVGTIEPRKNHQLLLDIWTQLEAELDEDCPPLVIIGQRGWHNEEVFAALDRERRDRKFIWEFGTLRDEEVSALVQGSQALLFPSFAEGYGLPPIEAAALGVPALCADLPIYREVLGEIPIYLGATDKYAWSAKIHALLTKPSHTQRRSLLQAPPSWAAHFDRVLELI